MLAFVFDHDWTIVVLAIQWEINRKPLRGHQCISASVSSCTEKEIWWLPDAGIAPWNQTNKEYYKTASLRMMFLELVSLPPTTCIDCKPNLCWSQTAYTIAMVKLTSFIAFSALVIAPTFAAVLPNTIETSVSSFFLLNLCVSLIQKLFFFWINAVEMSLLNLPFSTVIWRDCLSENRISSFQILLAVSWV